MNWKDVGLYGFTHSGSTYLLNVFVELGLCIYRGEFEKFWGEKTDGSYEVDSRQRVDLGVWFPRFQDTQSFTFNGNIRVKWSHKFPSLSDYSRPIILMVRDPRDVLVSFSKRVAQEIEFHDFMLKPLPESDSGRFSLYPAYEWALYNLLVSCLSDKDLLCVVRFEDLRSNTAREIGRILDFLKFRCSSSLIDQAIRRSSHHFVKAASERWYALYPHLQKGSWRSMSRGKVGDWKESFGPEEKEFFFDLPSYALQKFGYEVDLGPKPDYGILGDSVNESLRDNLERGISAVEHCNVFEGLRIFRETASASGSSAEGAFEIGKAAMYCRWTEDISGEGNLDDPLAGKVLETFFNLDPFIARRPLILLAVARTYFDCGNRSMASALLEEGITTAKGHYFEMLEAGKTAMYLQDKIRAASIFKEACGYVVDQRSVEELAGLLMDMGHFILSVRVLRRSDLGAWSYVIKYLLLRQPMFNIRTRLLTYLYTHFKRISGEAAY